MWSKAAHADTKGIPSYGGWMRFRGIPLHIWNMSTFVQIGEACCGFIDAAPETVNKVELTEALIKVKDTYTDFLPAFIKIHDEEGSNFIIQIATHSEGRWLRERNPSIHSSFTKNAAENFNEYNLYVEQNTFKRNLAMVSQKDSPETLKSRTKKMNACRKNGPTKINKKFNKAVSFLNLNYEGDSDNSNLSDKIEKMKAGQAVEMTDKKKGKHI
ncbi:mitotic spindle checkpoint protein mad1 [Cucumis melo var. makuwa]|uniref:Mitotic spindle checkpoint protein mad1 n=1 Tax=Cucumis melo var. makuwa TaxID=1194695 RepID=A0A5D3DFT7_CUCMM|nr:mitotic spindle checkpoint protein mad1 [Cucumis melo var. makuwa]TYK22318.1 mitotic spindle checkpoint protein mad1 [Cucumis melo var. makuwa]